MVAHRTVARVVCGTLAGLFLLAPCLGAGVRVGVGEDADRTLAPYFFVPGEEGGADLLPLRSTGADVHIAGVVAEVTVTQGPFHH